MKMQLKTTGFDVLMRMLLAKDLKAKLQRVVRIHGVQLQRQAQERAKFKGHYRWKKGKGLTFVKSTGQTRRSIVLDLKNDGLAAHVSTPMKYAPYLEYGTRYMEAQPFMRPAVDHIAPTFVRAVKEAMKP